MAAPELTAAVEALLFASDSPLTLSLLCESLEAQPEAVLEALGAVREEYERGRHGVQLTEMAGGYLVTTREAHADAIRRLLQGKRRARLSRAALETLAIVAYKQPATRPDIESIRGVDCGSALATLLERDLITIRGRSDVVGRPLLYATTGEFLSYFGLRELAELPRPEELKAILQAREAETDADLFGPAEEGDSVVKSEASATPGDEPAPTS